MKIALLIVSWILVVESQLGPFDGILQLLKNMNGQSANQFPETPVIYSEYDFIVVGAGTAGCVLANRLSENPKWNVLLLEAGEHEGFWMDIPITAPVLQFTESNWAYKTEPGKNYCLGMEGGRCNWPRGKVVGGSSVLNFMIYTRGNRKDYDNWSLMGNEGWSYDEVLPYFKKIENFTIEDCDYKYHGKEGFLNVAYPPYHTKTADALVKSNLEMGNRYVDYDGEFQTGVTYLHATLKDGLRQSSNKAYLTPIRGRKNLHLRTKATVKRILIDTETKRATGVAFVMEEFEYEVRASKEVVVSAGAINSPQLLMLSGIGPRKLLEKLNITVEKNSAVGYNLMDHIAMPLVFTIDQTNSLNWETLAHLKYLDELIFEHGGPLAIPGGCEVISFHDMTDPTNPYGHPNMEFLYNAGSLAFEPLVRKFFGIRDDLYRRVFGDIAGQHSFMIFPMLLLPKSKGRITLASADFKDKPLIFPNYLADPDDVKTIIAGVRLALNITSQSACQRIGTKLHSTTLPDCAHFTFLSDDYIECWTKYFTLNIYHYSGTCKMGPSADKSAVVDPRLRVYGVQGLRVADASIMPEIIAGHTNAPVYMIAEKAADMIKQDWDN